MGKVKNKKAVSKIAVRCMLSRKSRSFIAIAAIALTSVLFRSEEVV